MKTIKIAVALCAFVHDDTAQAKAPTTSMNEDIINVQLEQCNMTQQEAVEKVCDGFGLNISLSDECSGCSVMSCDSDGNISGIVDFFLAKVSGTIATEIGCLTHVKDIRFGE